MVENWKPLLLNITICKREVKLAAISEIETTVVHTHGSEDFYLKD